MEVPNIISKGVGLTWFSYWYSMILVHEFYYSKYKYIYIYYIYIVNIKLCFYLPQIKLGP
jgi:hypothetical protein